MDLCVYPREKRETFNGSKGAPGDSGQPGGGVAIGVRRDFCSRKIEYDTNIKAVGAECIVECMITRHLFVHRPISVPTIETHLNAVTTFPRTLLGCDLNANTLREVTGCVVWLNSAQGVDCHIHRCHCP